jgi:hypothetical protein
MFGGREGFPGWQNTERKSLFLTSLPRAEMDTISSSPPPPPLAQQLENETVHLLPHSILVHPPITDHRPRRYGYIPHLHLHLHDSQQRPVQLPCSLGRIHPARTHAHRGRLRSARISSHNADRQTGRQDTQCLSRLFYPPGYMSHNVRHTGTPSRRVRGMRCCSLSGDEGGDKEDEVLEYVRRSSVGECVFI